jgi:hypothetical protein
VWGKLLSEEQKIPTHLEPTILMVVTIFAIARHVDWNPNIPLSFRQGLIDYTFSEYNPKKVRLRLDCP